MSLSIEFRSTSLPPQQQVRVFLRSTVAGSVTVHSDLAGQSQVVVIPNPSPVPVDIGLARPGVFALRLEFGTEHHIALLFLQPRGGALQLAAHQQPAPRTMGAEQWPPAEFVARFVRGVNQANALRALTRAAQGFPAEEAAAIGSALVFCTVAAGVAAVPVANARAALLCIGSTKDLATSFAARFLDQLVVEVRTDGVITAAEEQLIRKAVGSAFLIPNVRSLFKALGRRQAARRAKTYLEAINLMSDATPLVIENEGLQMVVGSQNELLQRTATVIDFTKRLKP